jgi:hypothetical protein
MTLSRLKVRVHSNLEWVLGPDDNSDEQPICLWTEHARDEAAEPAPQAQLQQRRAHVR